MFGSMKSPGWRGETSEAMSVAQHGGFRRDGEGDPDPDGRLWPGDDRLFQGAEIHRRAAGKAVRRPDRGEIPLEHHGFRLSRRGHPVAHRKWRADARLSVIELPDGPRSRARLRRSAVPVRATRSGT